MYCTVHYLLLFLWGTGLLVRASTFCTVSRFSLSTVWGMSKQADAGRDCRTRLVRPISQARTRTGKYPFSLFSWPWAGLATLPRLIVLCYMWWPYRHTYYKINSLFRASQLAEEFSVFFPSSCTETRHWKHFRRRPAVTVVELCLKKNLNAPRPSEHPPVI